MEKNKKFKKYFKKTPHKIVSKDGHFTFQEIHLVHRNNNEYNLKKIILLKKDGCFTVHEKDAILYKGSKLGWIDEMLIYKYGNFFSDLKIKVVKFERKWSKKLFFGRKVYKKTKDCRDINPKDIEFNVIIKPLSNEYYNNEYYLKIYDRKRFRIVYSGYFEKLFC